MYYFDDTKSIIDKVIDMYLEKFPLIPKYGITLVSSENNREGTYYYEMSDDELQVLKAWKHDNVGLTLHEYLQLCVFVDKTGKYSAMMERWLQNDSPFELNKIKSCDLDNPKFFTKVNVHIFKSENELYPIHQYSVPVTLNDMKSLLSLFIDNQNYVTCNQLVYHNPIFSAKMMHDLSWNIGQWAYESTNPFIVEMTEIKQIVENICSPEKDVLGLISMQDNELISIFLDDFQMVPHKINLYDENKEDSLFQVLSYFYLKEFIFEQIELVWSTDDTHTITQSYDADILCKKLGLSNYQALQDYVKEHYSVETAFADFKAWAEQNCKECIL